jgi:CHAT domain-containing protein
MNDVRPRHPEAQTMAAFIEGVLAPDEIAAVSEHLRGCGDCRTVVAETARFEREEARRVPAHVNRWWLLAVAAVLAAIAITVPLRWMATRNASPINQLIAAAPQQHRFGEARLSGWPWAQLQAPPRGEALLDAADSKLHGAAFDVLAETADQQQPESRHAKGVAYLLIDRRSDSIATLQQAANGSNDPHTWNDLAAARYAVAIQDEHPYQLPLALADADHALRLDPKSPEALFNRALILEHLGVRDQARKAWLAYLAIDSGSAWSVEARTHLRTLETTSRQFEKKMPETEPVDQLVREFPEEARRYGETPMLASWAKAEAAGDTSGAAAKLARIRAIADALASSNGEQLLADAVGAIERSDSGARAAIVSGHRIYDQARMDYGHRLLGKAEPQFRSAAELFSRAGSPMALVANYYAAQTVFDQNLGVRARAELQLLLSTFDVKRYRALGAEIHWQLAICANGAGDWGTAAREADAASTVFHALGERENAAVMDSAAAIALDLIGEKDSAWDHRLHCFAQLGATNPQKLSAALRASASTLAATGQTAAAAAIVNLLVEDGQKGNALNEADAARFFARNGDFEHARQSLGNARSASLSISDAAYREFVNRQIDLADGSLNGTADARSAITSLDRSIDFFSTHQASVDLAEAYLLRARAERALEDGVHALADMTSALREVEKQRATIPGAEAQSRFLDVAGQIIAETIELHLSQNDVQGAFDVADHSRVLPGSPALVTVPRAAARPQRPDIAVVEYAVLPHQVIVFLVTRDGLTAQRIAIDRSDLESRVTTLAELIRRRAPIAEITSAGGKLHHLLIEPLLARLAGEREIVIVPDHELFALPFAALWDNDRKQYLTEQFIIRFAPSATSRPESPSVLQPALVVADPPTPNGARLPASRKEADNIAALYPGTTTLTGEAATRTAFTDAARGSALIHFAGHADSDASASYGALLFASDGDKPVVLGSNDIAHLRLDRNPLVVLAGCGTFRGDTNHVAGMTSLAGAFLTAGARAVIATLWEIDDDVSAPFFQSLHEHLRAGASPAIALRQAQADLIHSTDPRLAHPATWSAAETLSN